MTSIKDALRIAREYIDEESQSDSVWSTQMAAKAIKAIDEALVILTTPAPGRDELRERIEEILQATKRNPLMVGFVHSRPTVKELQERLDLVAELTRAILSALPVAPVVDEAAIRADEREKCAAIAESAPVEQAAPYTTQRNIAQAIRAGGDDAGQ